MITNFVEIFALLKYPLFGLFSCLTILSFFWTAIFNALKLKAYNNVQRVHKNEVSRLGGLFIYLFFWIILLFDFIDNDLFLNILISSLPFVFVSVKEDIFHNTTPVARLLSMTISCFIFFYINPYQFPNIDIPYLGDLINFYPISIGFFSFTILILMNGNNLIDGVNGLFGLTTLFQLFSIIMLANMFNDLDVVYLCLVFALPLITYLLFNFPFGRLFAGDTGAYIYGYMNAIVCIYFFGKHEGLVSWLAVLIMFYPCMELLFSFIRKLKDKSSPFEPDLRHIHSLLFKYLSKKKYPLAFKHSLISIVLMFFSAASLIAIFFKFELQFVAFLLVLLCLFYVLIYIFLKRILLQQNDY